MFLPSLTEGASVATILTLSAMALLVYTYVGYPVMLWLISRLRAPLMRERGTTNSWPPLTVVISAYNEEAVIARRIQNLLDQDYPSDRVEILIGSDGSTDATCQVVASYRSARVQLAAFRSRRGKASVLNDLVRLAGGEIVIFTDAATVFYPDALQKLVTGFWRYPSASVVVGELEMRSSRSSRNLDGWYWRYELFLKELESQIGAGLGASGTIYAVRRQDYCPLPPDTLADDLLEPLLVRLRTHGHVVQYGAARAWQLIPERVADEFHRRVRSGAGIAHVLRHTWRLLLPQWGVVALALWSHKALRLFAPWMLLASLAGTTFLLEYPFYRWLFMSQALFYGAALCAGWLRAVPIVGKAAVGARYFVVLNAALALGSLKFLLGKARPTWNRTKRPEEEATATRADDWAEMPPDDVVEKQRPAA
jgi:cellulose synthase/poly-beta-1,6-N-acetylglucosamine synthase-like glycosyltransferase